MGTSQLFPGPEDTVNWDSIGISNSYDDGDNDDDDDDTQPEDTINGTLLQW